MEYQKRIQDPFLNKVVDSFLHEPTLKKAIEMNKDILLLGRAGNTPLSEFKLRIKQVFDCLFGIELIKNEDKLKHAEKEITAILD